MPEAKTAMISCKQCATPNSLDSAFCKKCGKALAQEESIDARETIEKQLDHGFELFHHGRTDEAWLNLESCLLADPENLRAISLKGMILERRGLVHEAIDCFEIIVAKDPNAALERMKLQTLRGTLDLRKNEEPQQHRRFALAIAVCVTLLLISVIGAFAFSRRSQPQTQVATNQGEKPYSVDNFSQTDRAQALKQAGQTESTADQKTDNSQDSSKTDPQNAATPQYTQRPAQSPLNGALPNPADTDTTASKPVNPLDHAQITPIQSNTTEPTVATPTNNANVGAPTDGHASDPDPSAVAATVTQKQTRPAVVDIKLSEDQPKDSDLAIDANGIEAMLRAARSQFQIGSYQAAASTYEKALTAGADPAMTNQRLAQCYERLGRTSEAKAAYGRAINAIQSQIDGGKGNKDRLLAALNSSQQALRNLQGG